MHVSSFDTIALTMPHVRSSYSDSYSNVPIFLYLSHGSDETEPALMDRDTHLYER